MASDYERITDWERRTGATFANWRRRERFWDDIGSSGDVPF